MTPRAARRNEARRLDAMLDLPLARFRRTLAQLSDEDLTALDRRIALREIRHRWDLGAHGMARHRAPLVLGLLARRRAELALERETRTASASRQLRLVETDLVIGACDDMVEVERAA